MTQQHIPRYLPQGDYIPYGWPQGTGVEFIRTDDMPRERMIIAEALANFGCEPSRALRIADILIEEGIYGCRLGTATALNRNLWDDLKAIGIRMEFEQVIPEGNTDHAMMEKYRFKEKRSSPYPGNDLKELLEKAAGEQEISLPRME